MLGRKRGRIPVSIRNPGGGKFAEIGEFAVEVPIGESKGQGRQNAPGCFKIDPHGLLRATVGEEPG